MATILAGIHPEIIQTNILPRLDGRSLSTIATVSSDLHTLSSDQNLWSHISKTTWPSITYPLVNHVISTFPDGHRSFFLDSFPSLTTDLNRLNCRPSKSTSKQQPDCSSCYLHGSTHPLPSQIISAVDIRYQTDVIYSTAQFTDTTTDFLSSEFNINLTQGYGISRPIDMKVDELAGANEAELKILKESLTLNWILIDPTLKRAGNLSSIKPVSIKKDWMTNEPIVLYVVVLPGCELDEMVQCRIKVVLGVGDKGEGLKVKEVVMKVMDLDSGWLNGREFLVILQRAILMENNVRRKVVDDEERLQCCREFKEMKKLRREYARKEEYKKDRAIMMNYVGILVSFCFSVYSMSLVLT